MTGKIGILGASGFVGSALCERLFFEGSTNFVPFVHSAGNAWRIARFPLALRRIDILDKHQLRTALEGCDVIVNCALGGEAAKTRGLDNVLDVAKALRVRKLVHISSIAIYGQDPASSSATEEGAPAPGRNLYGILKLRQDEHVFAMDRAGVAAYILCPGNITGPYSFFARALVERLMQGSIPLVDGGENPSNLIHVDNLVEAILAAVRADTGAGQRYFVNETKPVSWRQLFDDLGRRLDIAVQYVNVSREEVVPLLDRKPPRGLRPILRSALSSEFREAVAKVPPFGLLNRAASASFDSLPESVQTKIRQRVRWPVAVSKPNTRPPLDDRFVTVQARRIYHSTAKISNALGWRPPLSYEAGLEGVCAWLEFAGVPPSSRRS